MQQRPLFLRYLFIIAAMASLVLGQSPTPAYQPLPRSDRNSQLAHEQLIEKARRGKIDVYFVGDSITRRWGATDYPDFLANWKQNFFGWNAANFRLGRGYNPEHPLAAGKWRTQRRRPEDHSPTC